MESNQKEVSRRSFLKSAGAVGSGATAFTIVKPELVRGFAPERLKAGLIGCGGRGTEGVTQLLFGNPNVELVAMGDIFEDRLEKSLARIKSDTRYPGVADRVKVAPDHHFVSFDAYQKVLAADVDIVLLCTPPGYRPIHFEAAIEAGKHVFCEKPLALNQEELDQISAVLEAGPAGILTVGFNRRFSPFGQRLKAFLDGRGEPLHAHYRVNAGYLPDAHWLHDPAQGGGRIIGEGCHFVDFLSYLVGSPPVQVEARGLPDAGRYHEDNVLITLRYSDGSLGTVTYLANGDRSLPKERVEVFCAGRAAVLDDFRQLELLRSGRREVLRSRLRQDKGHRAGWEAFLQAARMGGPPPIPYDHLIGVTRATFMALRSLRSGRAEDI